MKDVLLIVLGSVLALMTSFIVEIVKGRIADNRTRRLLRSLLKAELPAVIAVIERLVDEAHQRSFIPLVRVIEIDNTRQGFDRNRDWSILFKDDLFRRDLFEFYGQLHLLSQEARNLEGLPYDRQFMALPTAPTHIADERQRVIAKYRDLAGKGRSVVVRIDSQ